MGSYSDVEDGIAAEMPQAILGIRGLNQTNLATLIRPGGPTGLRNEAALPRGSGFVSPRFSIRQVGNPESPGGITIT